VAERAELPSTKRTHTCTHSSAALLDWLCPPSLALRIRAKAFGLYVVELFLGYTSHVRY
jgi:hypothetical protein